MAKRLDDDLFAGTTMTFGEHLEELRVCLFKALLGLFLGVLLGMAVAHYVVTWIQTPLSKAIENYYVKNAVTRLENDYKTDLSPAIVEFMRNHRVTYDEVYLERTEVERLLKAPEKLENPTSKDRTPESPAPGNPVLASPGSSNAPPVTPASAPQDNPAESSVDRLRQIEAQLAATAQERLPAPSPSMVKARLWRPMRISITSLNAQEVFMIWMKASLVTGLVLSSPWIFYQVWLFVAAGLYPHEKNYVYLYLPLSIGLFLAGACTAFFFVFEPVLNFLFSFNQAMNIDPEPRISEWTSFVLLLPVGFGVSFQLPLVMLFLHRIGIVSVQLYLERWRVAILAIFVIAMVLTPADPVSMLFMACPLTLLYFLGIGLCQWMPQSRNPYAAE